MEVNSWFSEGASSGVISSPVSAGDSLLPHLPLILMTQITFLPFPPLTIAFVQLQTPSPSLITSSSSSLPTHGPSSLSPITTKPTGKSHKSNVNSDLCSGSGNATVPATTTSTTIPSTQITLPIPNRQLSTTQENRLYPNTTNGILLRLSHIQAISTTSTSLNSQTRTPEPSQTSLPPDLPNLADKLRKATNKSLERYTSASFLPSNKPKVKIPQSVFQKGEMIHRVFIVGKFLGRPPAFKHIQNVLNALWNKASWIINLTNALRMVSAQEEGGTDKGGEKGDSSTFTESHDQQKDSQPET